MEIQGKSELPRRMSGLLWGMAGCGKTTYLSSLPQPILYVMIDPDGKDSIPEACDYFVLDLSGYENGETVRALKDKVPSMIAKLDNGAASVVVDSLTVFANRGLAYAIEQGIGESKKSNWKPTIEEPGLTAYGARRQYITHAVSNILRVTARRNMHCFFTTHQDDGERNEKNEIIRYTMMLGGKAVNDAALQMSEVWWMREHDGKRFVAMRNVRMREPMKTRIFDTQRSAEFEVKFDINGGVDQPHSLASFHNVWKFNNRNKLPMPDTVEYMAMYEKMKEQQMKE